MTEFMKDGDVSIEVTHIINPHDFYVRLKSSKEILLKLNADLTILAENGLQPVTLEGLLKAHTVLCYHSNHGWSRARHKLRSEKDFVNGRVNVFYIDFGEIELVTLDRIKPLLKEYHLEPSPLALWCRLYWCEPANGKCWTVQSVKVMKMYIRCDVLKMNVRDINKNGQLEVDLVSDFPDTVSMMLIYAELAILGNPQIPIKINTLVKATKSFFKTYKLEKDKLYKAKVTYYDTHQNFQIRLTEHEKTYQNIQKEICTNFRSYNEVLYCSVGQAVCVEVPIKHHSHHRAKILSLSDDNKQATVNLVDTGHTRTISLRRIRECLDESILETPPLAFSCYIENQQADLNTIKKIHLGAQLCLNILKSDDCDDTTYSVYINNIKRF